MSPGRHCIGKTLRRLDNRAESQRDQTCGMPETPTTLTRPSSRPTAD